MKESQKSQNPSREMRAVLKILNSERELVHKALPFVDLSRERIDWPGIFKQDYGGGHLAALLWAKAIWCDRIETKTDPFDRAFSMGTSLQVNVLKALAIRWGLSC